jgi:hypothetical protein
MKEYGPDQKNETLPEPGIMLKFLLLITIIMEAVLVSCTGKDGFTTGDNFIEGKTKVAVLDTFRIDMSTVLLDSIATSGTGIALAGSYHDDYFGSVTSVGYFEPGYKSLAFDGTEVYDSASIALVYSGYSYGDTSSLMSVSIHQLDEAITLYDNTYLYNTSEFDFSDEILGSKIFYPEPHSTDTLYINSTSFGKILFDMYQLGDDDISSSELFLKFFKGFVLKCDFGNSIIGFKTETDRTFLKLYYHVDGETVSESSVTIPFGAVTKQFNSVRVDFTDSELADIKPGNIDISADKTGDKAFLLGLVGLLPKITFPTLQNITLENRWKILEAELVLEPVRQTYSLIPLPDQLYLYSSDKYNRAGTALTDNAGETIIPILVTDEIFNENTSYTFDITYYINSQLSDGYFDSEDGLLIGLTDTDMKKTFGRLLIENKNPAAKLRLYYLTY